MKKFDFDEGFGTVTYFTSCSDGNVNAPMKIGRRAPGVGRREERFLFVVIFGQSLSIGSQGVSRKSVTRLNPLQIAKAVCFHCV